MKAIEQEPFLRSLPTVAFKLDNTCSDLGLTTPLTVIFLPTGELNVEVVS